MRNNILFLTTSPDVETPEEIDYSDFFDSDVSRLGVECIYDRNDEEISHCISQLQKRLPQSHFVITNEYIECIRDTRDLLDDWKEKMIETIRGLKHYQSNFAYTTPDDYCGVLICVWDEFSLHTLETITDFLFDACAGDKYYFAAAFGYRY